MSKIKAGSRSVEISHPDREMFPDAGCTKRDVAAYYARVAKWMLPHLRRRPIHLRAYPGGIDEAGFVRKSVQDHFPDWIETATLAKREGGEITQPIASDAATLAFLAGQNAVSFHGWLSLCDRPENPDQLIIDLDPAGDDFGEVREAAAATHEVFDELGLPTFIKTTGSRGLHVVTPLDRSAGFDVVGPVAREIAHRIADRNPSAMTVETRKDKRGGRLFVDWLRNGYAQTAVVPYSVRARPGAPVSMPIGWEELAGTGPRGWTIHNARERLIERGDAWKGMRRRARGAGPIARKLDLA